MVKKVIDNFSIHQICESGQCFRMNQLQDGSFEVIAFSKYLRITQKEKEVYFHCSEDEFNEIWFSYFNLDTNYGKIIDTIDENDKFLLNAARYGYGIRILRQDLWEMIISFIISQRNNIKRIRKCIAALCEKYGTKKISEDGYEYYDFPTPEALFNADIEDIKALGVGYRDIYIKKAAEAVYYDSINLEALKLLEYEPAKEELLKLYGIGEKVADCICLFALHLTESFPKDTHIFQVLDREYPDGFDFERYKDTAGIMQQYMFYNELGV